MPPAKQLPSGKWRTQVFSHKDAEGIRHYESFTADTKKKSERLAAEFIVKNCERQKSPLEHLTFGEALDDYIEKRSSILSPGTIREYTRSRKHDMQELMDIKLPKITQTDIQRIMNTEALTYSPKTVRNMHRIISAVMSTYQPDFNLTTQLPQKIRPNLHIPTDNEVKILMDSIKGTRLEIPVLLAAFGPMP